MDISRYAELFLTESREHLSVINAALLELERAPRTQTAGGDSRVAADAVDAIFRGVHTIKGMSATMGYDEVAELSHEMESLLDRVRRQECSITPGLMDAMFLATDMLESAAELSVAGRRGEVDVSDPLSRLRAVAGRSGSADAPVPGDASADTRESGGGTGGGGGGAVAPAYGPEVGGPGGREGGAGSGAARRRQHVRIDLSRLDVLMNLIGELVIARGRLIELAAGIGDPVLDETVAQSSRLITDLQEQIMASRMVPVAQVFDRFPRLVRDSAHSVGKQVDFAMHGQEIELDRSMLDDIGEPVVHLLRNAVDHGIETPDVRTAAGKPPAGRLALTAARDRSAVLIRVSDDGKGIDRRRVLARARELGLIDGDRTEMADEELLQLIARPGFSTAERVTGLSGRGVGIDAVQSRVRALGGSLDVRSTPGEGTTVTVRLPLTLAIIRALLARIGVEIYALPLTHVNETVPLAAVSLRTVQGKEVLILRDSVIPLVRLRDLMQLPRDSTLEQQVVVVELADRRVGILVDELTGQQEVVVKQFDSVRGALPLFSGATILGDGAPALIVDINGLLQG